MMPFFFSSMLFRAVGKCADTMIRKCAVSSRKSPA
jgi:Na+/H+-translocating membrane pyrophosphatase